MPAVRVDLAYLTSPSDRELVVQAPFRNRTVEAMIAAVQRMYFPVEQDVKTGSIDVSTLRAALPTAVH
jgi:N-acetylmuramoyl-L-alanine amidase